MSDPEDIVDVDLSYELPSIVKSLKESWLASGQTAAFVTALLAALSVQLFVFMKDDGNFSQDTNRTAKTFLQILSYSAIVFNASATFTSLILVDRVGELTIRASMRRAKLPRSGTTRETSLSILKHFGMGKTWIWVMCHWLFSLLIGIWCILLEILVYIFMQESEAVQITMAFIFALAVMPLMLVPFGALQKRA